MKTVRLILMVLAIQLGLWMAYTCHSGIWEWCIGGGAAVMATIAGWVSGRAAKAQFRPRVWMLVQGWRIPWYVLVGTWELIVSTYRQFFRRRGADSYLAAFPFEFGAPRSARESARRMLAVFYPTLTPNFVVLGPVREQNLMLYHQVLKGDVRQMIRNLAAGKQS